MLWLSVFGCLIILFTVMLIVAHRNTYKPVMNNIEIDVAPSDFEHTGLRILHLSDIHMEHISITAEKLIHQCQGQPIDLLCLTGDYLDKVKNIDRAVKYVNELKEALQPRYGTFMVFGNHDYCLKESIKPLRKKFEDIGCIVMQNESRQVEIEGNVLHVIGIDDYHTRRSNLEKSYEKVNDEGLRLVLTHDPNVVLDMKDYHYDYLLSGHFHGGQIHWPRPYHAMMTMGKLPRLNMIKGLHYHDERAFYISEGLGQTGINIRVNSRPEITFHTIGLKQVS